MKLLPALALLILVTSLPAAETHLVVKGDTLHRIARQHGCTVTVLKEINGLKSDLIRLGQVLKLPETLPAPALAPVPPPAPVPTTLSDRLQALHAGDRFKVQLFLDDELFAPGKVDGLTGEFTTKAAERWIAAAPGRDFDALLRQAREKITATQQAFTIPESAAKLIGVVPAKTEEKAALTALPYETLAEYTAERFHTDLSTLRRLNPGLDIILLKVGDTLQVPAVKPFCIESWPDKSVSARTAPEGIHLRIQHDARMIEVLRADGTPRAAFPVTVSPKPEHRRTGEWYIRSLTANPTFLWDDELLKNGVKGTKQHLLPPGPNNPVGILWLEIEPVGGPEAHIGIHGTADPARIGRNHSSGCIRLANWDIVRLAKLVGKGTRVAWTQLETQTPALAAATSH
ncbi:MAG: LysM peptidoglycan-binding domain-containing protein [Verrucomicrobiaceae bacterium]|nr:LysM peptidoglycan-binding domain-containing protein [Verrucomicrobiaceae bacterium]